MVKRKKGVASHFWAHKMHVKMVICLAQSQCYGIGRKKLICGCQRSLLKFQILFSTFSQHKNSREILSPLKFIIQTAIHNAKLF
jgi:hypothetical protein